MVIDATAKFACRHEYVGGLGSLELICHKCQTAKPLPNLDMIHAPRLMFFPVQERKVG